MPKMDWWVDDLDKILRDLSEYAEGRDLKRVHCSSVALGSWADGVEQFKARIAELEDEVRRLREEIENAKKTK